MAGGEGGTVLIVGAGLAGGLLALALRERGIPVTVLDSPAGDGSLPASAISYGALPGWPVAPTPLARLAAGASRHWRRLQRRHGELGWRPRRLCLHGGSPGLGLASGLWPLPFAQVDGSVLAGRLPPALAACGVECRTARVERLEPGPPPLWRLGLSDGSSLEARRVVLAAGAGCRRLWPLLPERLRSSWAAVLALPAYPPVLGREAVWLPTTFQRLALERRAAGLEQPEWLVDAALVPWGEGALLGQHSLVRPGPWPGPPPPAAELERQLRQALAALAWGAPLASLPGPLLQAAVAFSTDGLPLVGPVAEAPGLWLFTGFSGGFSQVPVLAPLLARALGSGAAATEAQRRLRRLGLGQAEPPGTPGSA